MLKLIRKLLGLKTAAERATTQRRSDAAKAAWARRKASTVQS